MSEWWQVLIVAFSGGVLGGTVVYHLSDKGRPKIIVWKDTPKKEGEPR